MQKTAQIDAFTLCGLFGHVNKMGRSIFIEREMSKKILNRVLS